MYPKDTLQILGLSINGDLYLETPELKKFMKNYDWVLDFTASPAFQNNYIKQGLEINNKVAKGFLTDEGYIGGLLIEGEERNPRVDDLHILMQAQYLEKDYISNWLKREHRRNKKESVLVNVGVGCNSETTVVSDDLISLHSASFVRGIKGASNKEGQICLTKINRKEFEVTSEKLTISPLTILHDINSGQWEIRMKNGIEKLLKSEMGKAMPNETGGVFIGLVNYKTKTIHVTDVVLAPPDSEASEGCFIRGIDGLREQVEEHKKKSGQTFGYIGEWHSHPHGPMGASLKDVQTMSKFKSDYVRNNYSIPVFMIIVTPAGLISYVY
ncbi:Mov34/MPN/PAD-1 family protein [Muricauda sp. SCSIO 64092]|uniref:Mov34/MPN/PAD-1 family protein n=1 Tax=Allomuricauda sp. SCSIO 64092 TaxID=2908842 RepID=UPI001FF6BA94|nr:Mov34/MPN/PAD-1 family protein [Muricauda sp. SCSIO 64092]UOY05719.1 Mov34/MPN/PAD-1 family protein [Muricauda sp. SCSIO 64092]